MFTMYFKLYKYLQIPKYKGKLRKDIYFSQYELFQNITYKSMSFQYVLINKKIREIPINANTSKIIVIKPYIKLRGGQAKHQIFM